MKKKRKEKPPKYAKLIVPTQLKIQVTPSFVMQLKLIV
jgi:hypothetical protein